jgi:hypothetical protein
MRQASAQHLFPAPEFSDRRPIAPPPPSGVRLRTPGNSCDRLRQLAHKAESLGMEPLAFELFFIAARVDATGRVDFACRELEQTAQEVPEEEARFYRRAVRMLDAS